MGLEVGAGGMEEEEKKEKIPLCESIAHRPLQGLCPAPSLNYNHNLLKQGTGAVDHLTLLRLLFFTDFAPFWCGCQHSKIEFGSIRRLQSVQTTFE